jgi:hypothetical protein
MLKQILEKFDFVEWDRYIESPGAYAIYGWIQRGDGKRDFLILYWTKVHKKIVTYVTSSAKYDNRISQLTGISDIEQCKKISELLEEK